MVETNYEYYSTGGNTYYLSTTTRKCGQSFTVGTIGANEAFTLTKAALQVWKTGTPGNVTINLYAVDGSGFPTGAALSTGTLDTSGLGTSSPGTMTDVTMSSYVVSTSTKYALVMENTSSGSVQWYCNDAGAYAGGTMLDNTGSWSNASGSPVVDAYFQIWGNPPVVTNMKINIGDVWKDVATVQINIGDIWKDVTQVQVNIGDIWKTVF